VFVQPSSDINRKYVSEKYTEVEASSITTMFKIHKISVSSCHSLLGIVIILCSVNIVVRQEGATSVFPQYACNRYVMMAE
jgi:hypothetical protein